MYNKIGFIAGITGIACSIYFGYKLKKLTDVLNVSIDELSAKTNIDVKDSIVEAAVQRAVDNEIEDLVKDINRDLKHEIRQQVKQHIDLSYANLKRSVSDEIARQVKDIDLKKIEQEAVKKAKEQIAEKFDNKLDGLLEDFNDQLKNISKIYRSMAKSMDEKT